MRFERWGVSPPAECMPVMCASGSLPRDSRRRGLIAPMVRSVLRMSDPQRRFGRFDGFARLLFSTWMIWALAVTGSPLLWLFIVPEVAFCVAQWLPVQEAA